MSMRYRIEMIAWCLALFAVGAAAGHAWATGFVLLALFAGSVCLLVAFCVIELRMRAAHADWLCYALTRQRMPPLIRCEPLESPREVALARFLGAEIQFTSSNAAYDDHPDRLSWIPWVWGDDVTRRAFDRRDAERHDAERHRFRAVYRQPPSLWRRFLSIFR